MRLGSPELNGAIAVDIFIYFWIFFFLKPRIAFESSFERKKEKERKREREKERKREKLCIPDFSVGKYPTRSLS